MRLTVLLFALGLSILSAAPSPAKTQPVSRPAQATTVVLPGPKTADNIEAELVPLSRWAAPGSTVVVAVRQKIAPGWHTYWRNPGDSGGPTTLDWRLPTGVKAGEIVWPLPTRQRLMSLVNYGYSGEVYLPVPIEVPASARPGSALPLIADALFLVCSDQMCVPVQMSLRLDLPIRDGAPPPDPDHGAALQAVLAAAPRPAAIDARATLTNGVLTLSASGGPLTEIMTGAGLSQAYFYPFESGIIDHAAAQSGQGGPNGLSLNLTPGADLTANGLTGPVSGVLATDAGAWEITARPGPALAGTTGGRSLSGEVETPAARTGPSLILRSALFALLGGLILNLMPCVFPILAMKAAALAASAHQAREARRDGLLFLAGVLATFLILAGALLALRAGGEAVGWGFQLQSPAVIAGLALLMLAVGLNLSGVFHVGAGLQGAGAGPLARLPGGLGAFFTGVLAVVVAAPCTAPFMAAALGAALLAPWPAALLIFLMLGLGLGLPYVAVSLSPSLLRRFPQPGPWMDRLKGLLAFPMYGAALWLVWVFSRQTGAEGLALLLAAALTTAFALWLFGLTQGLRAVGGSARLSGLSSLVALAAALTLAVAAGRAPVVEAGVSAEAGPLAAGAWSVDAVRAAQAEGRPVLVNFTADWCVTCKINERAALSSPRVAEALKAANAVYLVGDWTRRDDAVTRELERHGRSGVPLYLLYPGEGGEPRILPQLLTEGVVIEALKAG